MELFKILGTIAIDTDQANEAIDETTKKAKDSEGKQKSAFEKIGGAAVKGAKVIAGAATAIGGAWIATIESTREYRVSMGKLETAFTTSGHSAKTAHETYSALNSVLGDSDVAVEAANHLAKLTDNQKDLNTWTDICTGVFATFGDSLPIEGLTEAANETAKTGELTGVLADALNWAGVNEDEFQDKLDKCTTEQERQKLITSTLNGLYKEAADNYKKNNKELIEAEKANQKLKEAMAQLGAVGEPILTAIKNKIADMVAAGVPKLEKLIAKIKDMIKWFKENKNTVQAWAAGILAATVTASGFVLVLKWSAIMSKATAALKLVTGGVKALNLAMKANIIGLIVSLIIGLVAAFVYLWKNNEGFRNFWINMWNKIKSVTGTAVGWIKDKFNSLKDAVSKVKTTFENIKKAIADKMDAARKKVEGFVDKVKGFFPLSIGKIFSNLKVPKISIKAGKIPYGIGGLGKAPDISVKWNAEGVVFDKPTIFATSQGYQGVGEAGKEAVSPINTLQSYISDAVSSRNEEITRAFEMQISRLISFMQDYFPENYQIMLNSGVLAGEIAPEINSRLADTYRHNKRGNTR